MSAKVIQTGFATVGYPTTGDLVQSDMAIVRTAVPNSHAQWMFVVIGNDFCWVKGLPVGEGCLMYKIPFTGPKSKRNAEALEYVKKGPDESHELTFVPLGSKIALARANLYLVSA